MPVTINGSGLIGGLADIKVPDGTASAPTISNIDDLNTGIFFPAEDTIAFSEGGTEVIRINSSGNVGIGTTSPTRLLDVNGIIRTRVAGTTSDAAQGFEVTNTNAGADNRVLMFSALNDGTAVIRNASSTSNGLSFVVASTERMRIDSSGNVGIGTSTPDYPLSVQSSGDANMVLKNSSGVSKAYIGTAGIIGTGSTDDLRIRSDSTNILFGFSGTERMRITSAGNVGIGTSSPGGRLHVQASDSSVTTYVMQSIAETNRITMRRANGTTSSPTGVGNGDWLGYVDFSGYDGSAYQVAARIRGSVDATPGTGDMPGGLSISLTADGGTTLTERMYINNAGLITGSGTSLGAWTAYTPTIIDDTTEITYGSGATRTGYYCRLGKIVIGYFRIVLGTGYSSGAGSWRISNFPVSIVRTYSMLASGVISDVSTATRYTFTLLNTDSTTNAIIWWYNGNTTSTSPFTFAQTDEIVGSFAYEAA